MFIIIGRSCSGKDTVARELQKRGYYRYLTYTTRPQRDGEPDDAYHFVSEPVFLDMIGHGEFMEYKLYHSEHGDWYYGSEWPGVDHSDNKNFIILTPQGYLDVKDKLPDGSYCIYIDCNNKTILKRLKKRGDMEEGMRRFEHDIKDFVKAYHIADHVFYNNDGTDIADLVDEIEEFLKTGRKQVRGIYPHDGYPHD